MQAITNHHRDLFDLERYALWFDPAHWERFYRTMIRFVVPSAVSLLVFVYGVVRAMAENLADLAAVVKSMGAATPESLATQVGVPMHPGAERYYRAIGVID